jgi:DNA primase
MNNRTEYRARLVAINSETHRYYREQLLTSPAAQGPCRYLTQRRLAHVLAADSPWSVGYAPAGWTSLTDHLNHAGFGGEELLAAGVACRTRTGGIVDRFRDRIMLPQRDHNSDVVGFIGRAAPGASGHAPKYLNSPRTEIYNKSERLFGLNEQTAALAEGIPVLVEAHSTCSR